MRTLSVLLLLGALLGLAAPALASTDVGACTPYLAFINPNPPRECVALDYSAINNFCVTAGPAGKCVKFVGPDSRPIPTRTGACTPRPPLAFINPFPGACANVNVRGVGDACVTVATYGGMIAEKCIFLEPGP